MKNGIPRTRIIFNYILLAKQTEKTTQGKKSLAQKLGVHPEMKTLFLYPPDARLFLLNWIR